jgi:hypothetical protein
MLFGNLLSWRHILQEYDSYRSIIFVPFDKFTFLPV